MCVCKRWRQRDWEGQRLGREREGERERESLIKPNNKCSLLDSFWTSLGHKPTSGAITFSRGNAGLIDLRLGFLHPWQGQRN